MQCLRYILPCGTLLLAADKDALCVCVWDQGKGQRILDLYTKGRAEWCLNGENPVLDMAVDALAGLVQDHPIDVNIPLRLSGTAFQMRVWEKLKDIKTGSTVTYSQLADSLGSGARAVGNAVGANPVSIFIPCHRVVAAGGSLGGYAGGLDAKKWLLERELILAM